MTSLVLVVDDHPVVPLALRTLIESRFEGVRALQAASLRQARMWYQDEPGLLLTILDIRLPDVAGLEGLAELHAARPEVPIVVFTGLDSEPLRRSALAMGAAAVVCKSENAAQLVDALAGLLPARMADATAHGAGSAGSSVSVPDLSLRQQQMWQSIAAGMSNIEIAERYQISLNTTKAHVRELLQRLGARNRTEAATLYFRKGASRGA
jgi:two-component system NarL family response regulator